MIRLRSFWSRKRLSASQSDAHFKGIENRESGVGGLRISYSRPPASGSRTLLFILLLIVLGAAPQTYAQQAGTVAVIDSRLFPAQIAEYKKQIELLNQKFQERTREVQKLASELRNYEIDLNTNRLNYTDIVRRERAEQLERMRKQYKRKSEDLEADVKKQAEILIDPVKEKITKSLIDFAQSKGISIVYDLATAAERGGLLYASPAVDITDAFVESYNRSSRP